MHTNVVSSNSAISRSGVPESETSAFQPRQKRIKVAKACSECRIQRTKCDSQRPCSNCESKGMQCSDDSEVHSTATSTSTIPAHAQREITRLRHRVQELEKLLKENKTTIAMQNEQFSLDTPSSYDVNPKRPCSDGIYIRTARSARETWYGQSSVHYFIRRTANFLGAALDQTIAADEMLPEGASKILHVPTTFAEEVTSERRPQITSEVMDDLSLTATGRLPQITKDTIWDSSMIGEHLTATQEEYFLSLYWPSYHTALFPIIDESEFKEHYRSLWTSSTGTERQPSALVDIVLAMCLQYGISMLPATDQGSIMDIKDSTIAGRWHYRRCQMLLTNELESPTISTMQCHLLCCIFLCCASFQNMAHSACALAVGNAYMLGLHLEPPQTLPLKERELRKRLWWAVHLLDSKIGMKLGRPFLLNNTHNRPSLPGDGKDVTAVSGSNFAPLGDKVTWLSFYLQSVKLFLAARAAYVAFNESEIHIDQGQHTWADSKTLDGCDELFRPITNLMDEWSNNVPDTLKTKRNKNQGHNKGEITGVPFSTDCSALDIEQFAPVWLQRQRIVLELMYHNLCVNLHRPFISFVLATAAAPVHRVEGAAKQSAAHAIAMSHIIHQVLTSTSILNGWLEAFQFQWSAAMTLVGFVLAYPSGSLTPAAREAINISISVFDHYGSSFAVATSAACIIRDIGAKIDFLVGQSRKQIQVQQDSLSGSSEASTYIDQIGFNRQQPLMDFSFAKAAMDNSLGCDNVVSQEMFDMAMCVDLWSDLDTLWQNTGANGSSVLEQPFLAYNS